MKNRILFTILFCGSLISAVAQQRAQSSFDHVNNFNLNNAYAGFDSCMYVFAQRKQQWIGVDGAPVNNQIQGHMPIAHRMGVGLEVSNWKAGLLQTTNVAGTVSKHLQLNADYHLGAALSLGYNQYSFGVDDVVAFDSDDYLGQSAANGGGLYGDLGLLFSGKQVEAGVSIPRLFSTNVNLDVASETNEFNVERYLNLHAAFSYTLNDQMELSPMVIYRSIPSQGAIADIKAGLRFRDMLGVNLGYRTRNGLLAAVDFTFNDQFRFGYAYDAGMSRLNGISSGSHEFLVGFRMCKPEKKKVEPEVVNYYASGLVSDAATGQPLSNKLIAISNATTGATQMISTDSAGLYMVQVDSSTNYSLSIKDADYEPMEKEIRINPNEVKTTTNLKLDHKQVILAGLVRDAETSEPLSGVEVTITQGEEKYVERTDPQGEFSLQLEDKKRGDELDYNIAMQKPGYESAGSNFRKTIQGYETIQLQAEIAGGLQLTPEKQPVQISEIIDLQPIRFELNSAKLTADAKIELDKVVQVLNDKPEMKIEIGAHTDCRGSAEGNMRLSQKRAESTLEYIRAKITNPERIDGKGYGESQPLSGCECGDCSQEEHDQNRRTEFRIIK